MKPPFSLYANFILAFSLLVSADLVRADEKDLLGKTAPNFQLKNLGGKPLSLADWKNKVVVLNFWASWCAPCQKEVPIFNRLQKEYGPEGVQFVGLAVDNLQNIQKFLQKIPIEYPVLIGDEAAFSIIQQYGNSSGVLPYTIFIGRSGKIHAIVKGGLTESYTRNAIEKLL